jgi:hypothetical protein
MVALNYTETSDQFTRLRFDFGLVRRIAVLKCWETRYAFDPAAFLAG